MGTPELPDRAVIQRRIGQTIRTKRARCGVPQKRLAAEAGLRPERLNRIEHGQVDPRLWELQRIGHALGITIVDLFREDGVSAA